MSEHASEAARGHPIIDALPADHPRAGNLSSIRGIYAQENRRILMGLTQERALKLDDLADEELVRRCLLRDEAAVRALTSRYNRRLYRIARSFLRNDGDAQDAVQATYVHAFTKLDRFRGESSFATWLTRIAMNEALGRIRRRRPTVEWQDHGEERIQAEIIAFPMASRSPDPELTMMQNQLRDVLERSGIGHIHK